MYLVMVYLMKDLGMSRLPRDGFEENEQRTILKFINQVIAIGVELYVHNDFIPHQQTMTAHEPQIPHLRNKAGRRKRYTDTEVQHWIAEAKRAGGNHRASFAMVCRSKAISDCIFGALVLVHREKAKKAATDGTIFAVAWDPGTYNCQSTNVMMLATVDRPLSDNIVVDCCPKADPRLASSGNPTVGP